MAEDHPTPNPPTPGGPPPAAHEEFDRELDLRKILEVGLATAGVSAAAFVVVIFLYRGLASYEQSLDPKPSPIAEANLPPPRPEPRLQETPEKDLAAIRREQDELLTTYGWVDRNAGIARLPIERAIELTLQRGLAPAATPAVAAPPASPTGEAPAPPIGTVPQ